LLHYCELKEVSLLGYCLLPIIFICWWRPRREPFQDDAGLQTSYTLYCNRRHGRSGHVFFEQRYKALLVDKDNYLLGKSLYSS
jgi:hypothetical protein